MLLTRDLFAVANVIRSQWSSGSILTAVREVLGSNRAAGSCVFIVKTTVIYIHPWARAVCTFPAVPRSTQPSTLCGTVNEYQLSG